MSQQRQSTVAIAYPSDFAVQAGFLTALAQANIDARFPLSDQAPKLDLITDKERILNCSGQTLATKLLISRYIRLTFSIKASPAVLFGLLGWGFGVVAGDEVTLLPEGSYQPPPTSLVYGHVGSGVQPFLLKSMCLNKLSISAALTGYTINVEMRGHGEAVHTVAYAWPECPVVDVARVKNGAFSVNSVDRLPITSGYDFTFDNRMDEKDPFTLASEDITRNERADEREHLLKWKAQDEIGDTLYTAGSTIIPTQYPWSFRVGSLTDGVTVAAPASLFEVEGGEDFEGAFRRSTLPYILEPVDVPGDSAVIVTREII